jgi:serine protease AprX
MRQIRLTAALVIVFVFGASGHARLVADVGWQLKVDPLLLTHQSQPGRSRVIVRTESPTAAAAVRSGMPLLGGQVLRSLPIVNGLVVDLPNPAIVALANNPNVARLSYDRVTTGAMERTGATIGATAVRTELGYDGAGVGVAVIDSGLTAWHDDLATADTSAQRVERFVDFTSTQTPAYDDYGHGTHVAGIVAGNGFDSSGARTGIAPGVRLTVLKVLDGDGHGRISDVIAALDYAVANKDALNIRVVNLSVATGIFESYNTDPLTLAARQAVLSGIVVVAAAGNNGRGPGGHAQYGGVTAPGNAPWVLTVGASSHMGTAARDDDTMAAFSSRGPAAIDNSAKPDLVCPGVGIESLTDPASELYATHGTALLNGTVPTAYLPYMSLSGTSMAAPVVTGTVALMLQANPSLTPNAVKAILQFTSQTYDGYDALTQGAGFLNARGAVELAAHFASPLTVPYPDNASWSGRVIWGNRLLTDVSPDMIPWSLDTTWGDDVPLAYVRYPNVVWGLLCGGLDCAVPWNNRTVATTSDEDADTVVWGTSDEDGDTVVWGTACTDPSCETVVWGR